VSLEHHLVQQIERSQDFFWHRLRRDAVFEYLPVDRPFELVDVGAGAGLLGEFLRVDRPRARYRFVEPIPSLESHLEQLFGVEGNAGQDASYAGAEFLTLLDVLEHQYDDRKLLGDVVAKMDPGATLFVTVPALDVLWSGWDRSLGHYRRYRRVTLRALLSEFPLEVIEISYLFPELVPAGLVRKVLWRSSPGPSANNSAEFPNLPLTVNRALYWIGSASIKVRRCAPLGSSLLAVAVRR